MNDSDFVYIDDYKLLGTNFYWLKYESKGLSKEDILQAGLTSDRVQIHKSIVDLLVEVDKEFQTRGYKLFVKEGYRSKELYNIVYKRRVEKYGKEETDKLLNMSDMPHSQGLSLDVALWDEISNKEVYMRKGDDGAPALFVDFYKNKDDDESQKYQELQEWVIGIMQEKGFRLGTKNEYFHFDYRPNDLQNYPK